MPYMDLVTCLIGFKIPYSASLEGILNPIKHVNVIVAKIFMDIVLSSNELSVCTCVWVCIECNPVWQEEAH